MSPEEIKRELREHRCSVAWYLRVVIEELQKRAYSHDDTKLNPPEFDLFTKFTPKLKECEYGSEEYFKYLKELKPALEHHYQSNRHHPEHFPNGISGMNLVDLVEMICDWLVSTSRMKNGDIFKSVREISKKRFGYGDEIESILENTAKFLTQNDSVNKEE